MLTALGGGPLTRDRLMRFADLDATGTGDARKETHVVAVQSLSVQL
jgi:hypothetical protein